MASRRPQKWGEMGWILETNKNMNRAMEAMGGRIVRRFRVYGATRVALSHESHRAPQGLPAYVPVRPARQVHTRASDRARRDLPPRDRHPLRDRHRSRRLPRGARPRPGRLRGVDTDGVLAAPSGVPLRTRAGDRRPPALDDPRRPPRSSERPDAPGDAAGGQRAARARVLRAVLRDAGRRRVRPVHRGLPGGVPGLRHDPLRRAPLPPEVEGGEDGCASCTCATTSRTTSAASASALRTGIGCSGRPPAGRPVMLCLL